jgi:RNase P/RNase MRP subunit p29
MFTRLQIHAVVMAIGLVALAAPAQAATDFTGRIVAATDNTLVLTADTAQHTFVVAKDTNITLNGEAASMQDIVSSFKAVVLAESRDGRWVAKTIAVYIPR